MDKNQVYFSMLLLTTIQPYLSTLTEVRRWVNESWNIGSTFLADIFDINLEDKSSIFNHEINVEFALYNCKEIAEKII